MEETKIKEGRRGKRGKETGQKAQEDVEGLNRKSRGGEERGE